MANMTNRFEKLIADASVGVSSYTFPSTTYVALFTADPTDAGSVANELSGNGYARVSLSGKFSASSDGSTANTSQIDFPTATADWTAVTHIGIMESGTTSADDMMYWGQLAGSVTILNGEVFSFLIGDLVLTLD